MRAIWEMSIHRRSGAVDPTDDSEIYGRCTNYALQAFGIKHGACLRNAQAVLSVLSDHGFETESFDRLDMEMESDAIWTHGSPSGERFRYKADKLRKSMYSKYKEGMTVARFAKTFPKGRYLIGTSGHSLALVDGDLWDYEEKGFSRKRVNQVHQVFTPSEYARFNRKYKDFDAEDRVIDLDESKSVLELLAESRDFVDPADVLDAASLKKIKRKRANVGPYVFQPGAERSGVHFVEPSKASKVVNNISQYWNKVLVLYGFLDDKEVAAFVRPGDRFFYTKAALDRED